MENVNVWTIVSLLLGVAAALFGGFLFVAKTKLAEVAEVVKQVSEYLALHVQALADNKYNDEEKAQEKKEREDVLVALKALFPKLFKNK